MVGESVAGRPVVHVTAFLVLLLFAFARSWIASVVTIAHEGGHIAVAILTGRYNGGFQVNEGEGGGGSTDVEFGWGAGIILSTVAGYLTPPLAGLAGVALLLDGRAWSLLVAYVLLLLAAVLQAKDWFTRVVVALAGSGVGWALARGPVALQEGVAVFLVWTMLFGSLASLVNLRFGGSDTSDAAVLARYTWIPRIVWVALWWFVAVVCFWLGARRLLAL